VPNAPLSGEQDNSISE